MRKYTGNSELIKEINRTIILDLVRKEGPISRADIAKHLNLSPSTVTNITKALIEENELLEIGEGKSCGGRRPILLEFNYKSGYVVGIYIGEVTIRVALADLSGTILSSISLFTDEVKWEKGIIDTIVEKIKECLNTQDASLDGLKSIGVAVSGITDVDTGIVKLSKYIEGWENYPLAQVIQDKLGVPVKVDNDMFMAALGEQWVNQGEELSNMILVTVGVGLGAGIVINGQLYRGSKYSSGELGDMIITYKDWETDLERGHLERRAGWLAIQKFGQRYAAENPHSKMAQLVDGLSEEVTYEIVFKAAYHKDEGAIEIIEKISSVLGLAIANLISLLDPEIIVLGGEIVPVGDLFLEPIRRTVAKVIPEHPPITLSKLGGDAEVIGAIKVAIDIATGGLSINGTSE